MDTCTWEKPWLSVCVYLHVWKSVCFVFNWKPFRSARYLFMPVLLTHPIEDALRGHRLIKKGCQAYCCFTCCCHPTFSGNQSAPSGTRGRSSGSHTGGRSTLYFIFLPPPSLCGASVHFYREKGSAMPYDILVRSTSDRVRGGTLATQWRWQVNTRSIRQKETDPERLHNASKPYIFEVDQRESNSSSRTNIISYKHRRNGN